MPSEGFGGQPRRRKQRKPIRILPLDRKAEREGYSTPPWERCASPEDLCTNRRCVFSRPLSANNDCWSCRPQLLETETQSLAAYKPHLHMKILCSVGKVLTFKTLVPTLTDRQFHISIQMSSMGLKVGEEA
jgi:hypothetical protein